jgi:hypothetical protein
LKIYKIKKKVWQVATVLIVLLILVAGGFSGFVIVKAPAITSIEANFAYNYTLMDRNNLVALGHSINVEYETVIVHEEESVLPTTLTSEEGESEQTPAVSERYLFVQETIPAGVTLIGDSISLGAQESMAEAVADFSADSAISRSVHAGLELMNELQERGELREIVVVALGTNETANYAKYFTQMIEDLPPGHRLVLVTPFDGRGNEYSQAVTRIADWQRRLPEEYDFITIADWASLVAPQAHLLAADKAHLQGQRSIDLYTACVVEALEVAVQGPLKR